MPHLPYSIRDKHIHVIGKTGMGKSTLLAWQAYNDILSNEGGVCVIDPKGGMNALAEIVSRHIPEDRLDDCIWLDLDNPVPLDFMSCKPGNEESVVADLKYILTKGALDSATSVNISANVENVLHTLLNANANRDPALPEDKRCTFLDIARFFRDEERQKLILDHVSDPDLRNEWTKGKNGNFPSPQDTGRIMTRMNPFIRSKTLSQIFGDPRPRLDLREVVEGKKIMLVSLDENNPASGDYGALLVAKIQSAVFARRNIPEEERIPFFLYVDEFQNFRASEKFGKMLTMARSFKLCLTLANLNMSQLDAQVSSALGIIFSHIFFMIDPADKEHCRRIIGDKDPTGELWRSAEKLFEKWKITGDNRYLLQNTATAQYAASLPTYVTADDASTLGEFRAIYKFGNAPAVIEDSPRPGSRKPTEEQAAKLAYIKFITQRDYGYRDPDSLRKTRPKLSPALQNPAVPQDEGDEHHNQDEERSEVISGNPSPGNLPLNKAQKGRTRDGR